ncbi:glycine zipper 2TM domain-containing protein [Novosphingobium bradum]|uniref:17 kDa surface antigen n=1 Tax=Novosphingobium bradum TaxID=1737444 RepID=A0ABV7IUU0_9SPHN
MTRRRLPVNKAFLLPLAALAATTALAGCDTYGNGEGPGYASQDNGWGYYDRNYSSRYGHYDWNAPDPRYNGYYADNYYRQDRRYRENHLNPNDRIYRGRDGRYYCRRSDGTTGLIVGAIAGGILGNIIAPGDSRTLGTVLGAIGGGAAGAAIDSGNPDVRCQ